MKEVWKPIPGYESLYEASNLGNIRSLARSTTGGMVLKQHISARNGYCQVSLSKDNHAKTKRVHRLIASAFWGISDLQVNHIDGDKTNNALSNLEYCTQSENMLHAFRTGLEAKGGRQVIDLDTKTIFQSVSEAAAHYEGRPNAISRVCMGRRSQYKNHHFAYLKDYENNSIPKFQGKYVKRSSEKLWVEK